MDSDGEVETPPKAAPKCTAKKAAPPPPPANENNPEMQGQLDAMQAKYDELLKKFEAMSVLEPKELFPTSPASLAKAAAPVPKAAPAVPPKAAPKAPALAAAGGEDTAEPDANEALLDEHFNLDREATCLKALKF